MSIHARGITKRFGEFCALDDVELCVPSGRLTALLGPSGGGKSTLLRIIGGLEQPDSGTVHIDGVEATGLPARRRNVGFVFQHYAAFKHLSVYRNVAFGLEVRKRPKAEIRTRVGELLELVHLEQFADRLPAQLSGASGNGWRWLVRSRSNPRCCCSTSRSAPWMPPCARNCGAGCGACTMRCT
jgi:sulfate transport system ATP-binding protein